MFLFNESPPIASLSTLGAFGNPIHSAASLEKCPYASDLIHVADSGIIAVRLEGDGQGNHAIGFRDGKMHVPETPVSIREDTPMTEAELEGLKTRLVNEIMGSLSAQLGIGQVYG